MTFPEGKMKAVTFSYDDGIEQDKRLIEIFNKYRLKCTFNLNSGIQSGANCNVSNGVVIRRLNMAEIKRLYAGHEVAVHTLTHPHLEKLDMATIENEISVDKDNLERIFGNRVIGMAYPYGTYDQRVVDIIGKIGIKYARTVCSSGSFDMPTDFLRLKPTCHHSDEKLFDLAEEFIALKPDEPKLFYIWGHSFEFDLEDNWDLIEKFCSMISGKDDIFYGTNSQVLFQNV